MQFAALALHKLEGMDYLIAEFDKLIESFKRKRHDLLDFQRNDFDRDYVEFNANISDLEGKLQQFINQSFESITSIEHSLNLLKKFQDVLQRETLRADLDDKFNIIFQTYGGELENVQGLYERNKHAPPIPRNLPPVAGAITWCVCACDLPAFPAISSHGLCSRCLHHWQEPPLVEAHRGPHAPL